MINFNVKTLVLSLVFLFCSCTCFCQVISICSWNLKNLGKSKDEKEILIIAQTIKQFDIIAIQEVVGGYGGPQAVARLAVQLNRMGNTWDYIVSEKTSGTNQPERYAFIWKKSKVNKIGTPWLESNYQSEIAREPFFCRFKFKNCEFTIANFHALPKAKQPETEIKFFKLLPPLYPKDNIIFCGDFNLPQSHTVFIPLRKAGYLSSLVKQKTSLRQVSIKGDPLASEYDNFFYNSKKINSLESGILHFYKPFVDLKAARLISDHVPVYFNFVVL
jgi:deoxyribonuclease-1-like protein